MDFNLSEWTPPTPEELARIEKRYLDSKTRMSYWYPKIKDLVRTPKTEIFEINWKIRNELFDIAEDKEQSVDVRNLVNDIRNFVISNNMSKFFLKDLVYSGKHNWKNCCYVADTSHDTILKHMIQIVCDAELVGCSPGLGFAVRELIDTSYSPFTAFDGMPVVKEFRMWVKDGRLEGYQPYWYEGAIHGHADTTEDYREVLEKLNSITMTQFLCLKQESERVASALDGFWAIDFLMCSNNKWWCIDVQEGGNSYVSPDVVWLEEPEQVDYQKATYDYFLRWQELIDSKEPVSEI